MKKVFLFLTLALLSVPLVVDAQMKVGSYYNSYFDVTYNIEAGESDIFIQVGAESKATQASVSMKISDLAAFKAFLVQTKDKFIEWSSLAKQNNVTKLNKEMGIKTPAVTVGWFGTKWYFSFGQTFTPKFIILDSGKHIVALSKKVTASSNQYIDETIYWVFSNPDEIDALVAELDPAKIKEILNADEKTNDLFK